MADSSDNMVTSAAISGDVVQIGRVHGNVSLAVPPEHPAPRPPDLVRVQDADPVLLGVHQPIRVAGSDGSMPTYVPRDLDVGETGLRARLRDVSARGGFVVLVGGSSVGKTRSLYEALNRSVPDWDLCHPSDARQIRWLAGRSPRRVVVWLDELQRYLDGERGLTAATLRELLTAGDQVLVVATLWPDHYHSYVRPHDAADAADDHRQERELLKLANIVHVASRFTPAERERAREAAAGDEKLRVALESADFGLTQVIAAAPYLVERWNSADCYARAVMAAAIDATLLGVRSAVTDDLLRAAAPGYCTPMERGRAPGDWFARAIRYATEPLLGATAPLWPVNDGELMGDGGSYRVADYLVHHMAPRRGSTPPSGFWRSCAEHLTDEADVLRVGDGARRRQRFGDAVPLLRRAAEAGSVEAMYDLTDLYGRLGEHEAAEDMVRRLERSDEPLAEFYRAELAAAGGTIGEMLDLAEAGNEHAVELLTELGDPEVALPLLLRHTDLADLDSLKRLANYLAEVGEDGKAAVVLELIFTLGCDEEVELYAEVLQREDRMDELHELVGLGYFCAARCLAETLMHAGDVDGALEVLREFADQGDMETDDMLAHALAEHGRVEELLARAESGEVRAAVKAAEVRHARGEVDDAFGMLVPLADSGHRYAASRLAELLAESGRVDDLRARAGAGDRWAARALADLFVSTGRIDAAVETMRSAIADADTTGTRLAERLAETLAGRGEVDQAIAVLSERAASGDSYWTYQLADLLKEHGREDELRTRVDMGDPGAAVRLYELLVERGRRDEARRLWSFGLTAEGEIACDVPGP